MKQVADTDRTGESPELERNRREGRSAPVLGELLFRVYGMTRRRSIRTWIRNIIPRFEDGQVYSVTLRRIFAVHHGVEIGMYSGRGCFTAGNFRKGTKIGRFTSIFSTARGFGANHPMNTKSTHAFFFNPAMGYAKEYLAPSSQLTIGSDVWIGHNAIISPSVSEIGHGAIIGAGAVVHQDVPPYAVVVGNPGRVVRYRFEEDIRDTLLKSQWWERSMEDLLPEFESFQKPLEGDEIR